MSELSKLEVLGASVVVVLLVAVVASAGVGLDRDGQSASERPAIRQPRIEPTSPERSGETRDQPDLAPLRAGDSGTDPSGLPEVVAHSAETLRAVGAELGLDLIVCRVDVAERARAWSTIRAAGVNRHVRAPARLEAGWLVAPVDREQVSVVVEVPGLGLFDLERGERTGEGWWSCIDAAVLRPLSWIHGVVELRDGEVAQVESCAGAAAVEATGRFSLPAARGECELIVQVVGADGQAWCWSAGDYTVGPSDLVDVRLRPDPGDALDTCRPRSQGRIIQGWYETMEMVIAERR